jgi:hypothetical protein
MSEANYLIELREAAPRAPERLRELVQAMPATQGRQGLRLRPALVAAVGIAVAVALGAAAIGGLTRSDPGSSAQEVRMSKAARALPTQDLRADGAPAFAPSETLAPALTSKARLQRQDVWMNLRVKDLSGSTQSAVRTTRRLGGFIAGADYSTGTESGTSRLALRVPVANLQKAIASFTELGTIVSQRISVADLQTGLDQLDVRIAKARRDGKKRTVTRLELRRDALIREGTYARVSLQLTSAKAAAKHVVPSRFDRFRDNAGDILGKELIGVLYAIVVAGPFILLAALLFFGERARRRRADHRLLEETG